MMGCTQKISGTPRPACSIPNCKVRRDSSHCITSKYCKKHTCEHFSSPTPGGTRCEKSKEPWDSVCSYHVICPIGNCNRARLQFLLSAGEPKFRREKYCDKHKCSLEGCAELRSTLGQQPFQYRPYCNQHSCQENGCLERHTEGFTVCGNHKCNVRGCPAPKKNSRRFCDNHNRCGSAGCTGSKEENQDFCSIHLQCETTGCRARKTANSRHCVRHTCRERDCTHSSGDYDYCVEHRCGYEGCGEHRTVGATRFCAHHSCQRRGCQLSRTPNGLYCETHTCTHMECGKERVFTDLCEIRKLPMLCAQKVMYTY
ncbi:hypothetical protein F4776DRAFT_126534 [Hypoxylon sp. NC0597]|nr:hypothetical protein F4776DRAFT_126534 [Hypoxylon sp. NC0597]